MPRACSICTHSERTAIEAVIVADASLRDIARQFSVSKDAVARHKEHCIKPAIQEIVAQRQEETAHTALSEMEWLREQAKAIFHYAWGEETLKDSRTALQALAELRRQNELQAKLEGELDEHSITITSIPEWRELRALLLDALRSHPQAKLAVIRALEAYDHAQSA